MSTVRMGRVSVILLVTPIAGWALDKVGYQVLFPIGALFGILATYLFTRIDLDEESCRRAKQRRLPICGRSFAATRISRFISAQLLFVWAGGTPELAAIPGCAGGPLATLLFGNRIFGLSGVVDLVLQLSCVGADDRQARRAVCRARYFGDLDRDSADLHVGTEPVDVDAVGDCAGIGDGRFELGRISAGIQLADPDRGDGVRSDPVDGGGAAGTCGSGYHGRAIATWGAAQCDLPAQRAGFAAGVVHVWPGGGADAGGRGLQGTAEVGLPVAVPAADCAGVGWGGGRRCPGPGWRVQQILAAAGGFKTLRP